VVVDRNATEQELPVAYRLVREIVTAGGQAMTYRGDISEELEVMQCSMRQKSLLV
jgi:hypothetical protein